MTGTDDKLRDLESWLADLYKQAEADLREKWDAYLKAHEDKGNKLQAKIAAAKTDAERKAAEKAYKDYLKSVTAGSKWYRDMVRETAEQYSQINARALQMINGERTGFYADGYNLSAGEMNDVAIREDVGIRFNLCSAEAVDFIALNNSDINLPPPKRLNITDDNRWNAKLLNSQMAQGIVQGESIPKIARRIWNVTNANKVSAVRAARTMATECQNAGRVQAMTTAEKMGVLTRKRWICTHDDRTRETHLNLDGVTIRTDQTFTNGCRFPGDHLGPPEEVWNCRCTLVTVVDGFKSTLPKGKEDAITVSIDGKEVYKKKASVAASSGFDLVRKLRSAKPAADMTSDELKAVGKAFYDSPEYKAAMQGLSPEEIQRKKDVIEKEKNELYRKLRAQSGTQVDWKRITELNAELRMLQLSGKDVVSRLVAEARGESRGFTSEQQKNDHISRGLKETKGYIADAYSRYPSSWVQRAADTGKLTVKDESRGYCRAGLREIAVSSDGDNARNTAVHELGHYFEYYLHGLRSSAQKYLNERTDGETAVSLKALTGLRYRPDEVAKKDTFVNPYMGKIYPDHATELISMGMEGVIGFTNDVDLSGDEDMRNWITGILLAF